MTIEPKHPLQQPQQKARKRAHETQPDSTSAVVDAAATPQTDVPTVPASVTVDDQTFSVQHRGRRCSLGPSIPFHFLARLARRPGVYVSHERLIDDVWGGHAVSPDTIRHTASDVRKALRAAGMDDLAYSIKSKKRHVYIDPSSL